MQDLTRQVNPASDPLALLAPSSQEAGNLMQPNLAEATMTAPGSEPVSPLPPAADGSNPTPNQSGDQIPVSFPGDQKPPRPAPSRDGAGRFADMHSVPAAGVWRETS